MGRASIAVLVLLFAWLSPHSALYALASETPVELEIAAWRAILAARVTQDGRFAYRSTARFDQEQWKELRRSLADATLEGRSRDERVAFWINAYNAAVIDAVLQGGRPEDLKSRARLYSWFEIDVAGRPRTLDEIEAELQRYIVSDPRIRFTLCNGARGAPALPREPVVSPRLDAQLARAARSFIRDESRNRLNENPPGLSMLFDWHRREFEGVSGSLAAYVAPFARSRTRKKWLGPPPAEPFFLPFDWSLNAAPEEEPELPQRR